MKKNLVLTLAAAFCLLAISGCGGALPEDEATAEKLRDVLGAGLEGLSAEDMDGLQGSDMDSEAAPSGPAGMKRLAGGEVAPAANPPAPPWWLFLHPGRNLSRADARRMIEAPAQLIFYILQNPGSVPSCALPDANTCPLAYNVMSDSCAAHFDFGTGCDVTFVVTDWDGSVVSVPLTFRGVLDHAEAVTQASSGAAARDGKWTWTDVATNLQVIDPGSLAAFTYDGKLTRSSDGTAAAEPYQWRHIWQSKAADNPITITNAIGQQLRADGTRSVFVLPGSSLEVFDYTNIALIPLSGNSLHVTRKFKRDFFLDPVGGETAISNVNSTITLHLNQDLVWKRTGSVTLHRINAISVSLNGHEQLTHPGGKKIKLQLIDVIVSLGHVGPVDGKAILRFPSGLVYNLVFSENCNVQWSDNEGDYGSFNYCQYDDFKE